MVFQKHVRLYLGVLYAFYCCLRCLGLWVFLRFGGRIPFDRSRCNGANLMPVASGLHALPSHPGDH